MEKNKALAKFFAMLNLLTITCGFASTPALATTPVQFRLVQNLIVTSVLVNGTGPFDFVVDTGASSTVIDSELAKQLSLSALESETVHTVTGSKTVYRYRVDSVALGPKFVRSLTVLCAEPRDMHGMSPKVRGVLGQNFLSEFDYILNYRDQRIEFEEGGEYAGKLQGPRLPVERDRGRVLITTQPSCPQKRALKLVMDSGVSSVVVFNTTTKNTDLEIGLDINGRINASTIVGSKAISTGRLRKLQIGAEKFSWLPVGVVDNRAAVQGRPEDGLLPTSLFRSIYFNNTQNFVILNPRPTRVLTSYRDDLRSKSAILIISQLKSHLPKGAILVGKDLPPTVKSAVRELVTLSPERQTAADLTDRLILIRDMNRFLDYKGVADRRQRDSIKRKAAFTIDEQWPIYLAGDNDLFAAADPRSSREEGPIIYKLAAVIAHERIHAQGEPSEIKAIEEEITVLEVFVVRRLVELEWLTTRKVKLGQLSKGQIPDEPPKINTAKPPNFWCLAKPKIADDSNLDQVSSSL